MREQRIITDVIKTKRIPGPGEIPGFAKRHGTDTRLEIPNGDPDIAALRSVTHEWLVPRLVEKFLRLHGVELKHSRKLPNVATRLQLSLPGRLAVVGGELGSGTPLAAAAAGPKQSDRRRTGKRNIGR